MAKQIYVKQDPITHILTRPDMYVGSKIFRIGNEYLWIDQKLIQKSISFSPAILRTFIEILSNAIDNMERQPKMTTIRVKISPTECEISNDGAIIPIIKNEKEGIYNHSLIFGHLLSGSNYDDTEKRYTSGRNGLGAKLTNVFSSTFTVEGVDPGLKISQTWTNNMTSTDGPKVTKCSKVKGMTTVRWVLDCSQFKIKEIPLTTLQLFGRYVLDAAMTTGLNVYLNGEKMPNKLAKYFDLIDEKPETDILKLIDETSKVFVTASSTKELEVVSFVNGVRTKKGGKHVDAWIEAVCRPIIKKMKGALTLRDVKRFFRFLIVSRVKNPEFDSQEKNILEAPNISATTITPAQVNKIMKWPIGTMMKELISLKEKKQVSNVVMSTKHPLIEGYDKANNACGSKADQCTLIVCEGLSAKTFAVAGIEHGLNGKKGRDWFGIYPLRGKLLNTRNATPTSIKNNTVITNLMKIIGLDYVNPEKNDKLNYGRLCIITDADVDGIHIEGLILNFFHSLFPQLLENGFVFSMKTPILKITTGKSSRYLFDERTPYTNTANSTTKYFKGLGTTKPEDVKNIFGIKTLEFYTDSETDKTFNTVFSKTESENRKKWLEAYSPLTKTNTLDDEKEIAISFSITKHLNEELVKFSHNDCKRSIPFVFDGLKESQRKIVYAAKKRNLISEVKVAQFGAYVAEHTNYHHGEQNLFSTIIKMAQTFPGTNNLPLFSDEGMFGTRLEGGADAASPRYIFTKITKHFQNLFPTSDDHLLKKRVDDGDIVEPYFYVPILPLILINGNLGIGTGWMSFIPQFSIKSVINNAKHWMNSEPLDEMIPSYNGFNGTVTKSSSNYFITKGIYEKTGNKIKITELPIGLWNDNFKKWAELNSTIVTIKDQSTPTTVSFTLTVSPKFEEADFEKKMSTSININNMVVFDEMEKIIKVSINDIFKMWGEERLKLNELRKQTQLCELTKTINELNEKIKFISVVRSKKIILTDNETDILEKINLLVTKNEKQAFTLLQLPIRTLTENKRTQLELQTRKLTLEFELLKNKTPIDLWKSDIAKIDDIYMNRCK